MNRPIHVLLATSVGPTCGIAEHSRQLQAWAMQDSRIDIERSAEALDPAWASGYLSQDPKWALLEQRPLPRHVPRILHLNYHRGLHSRWTGPVLQALKMQLPALKVLVTWHDTYQQHDSTDPVWSVLEAADAMVVHEPCDLQEGRPQQVYYWRQGVPAPEQPLTLQLASGLRPILGVFGHDFPWKNFLPVAEIAASVGWAFLHVGPRLSSAREEELRQANPHFETVPDPDSTVAVSALSACHATAFLYTCANSGTSGAIRWGIAAGRPVFAQRDCRQFRDLAALDPGSGIHWTSLETFADDLRWLGGLGICGNFWDARLVRLRTAESWQNLGRKYAELYRSLATGEPAGEEGQP